MEPTNTSIVLTSDFDEKNRIDLIDFFRFLLEEKPDSFLREKVENWFSEPVTADGLNALVFLMMKHFYCPSSDQFMELFCNYREVLDEGSFNGVALEELVRDYFEKWKELFWVNQDIQVIQKPLLTKGSCCLHKT